MPARRRIAHARLRGVTLIEVLVALAILAALAGTAAIALRGAPALVLDRTARGVAADLRLARQHALTSGRTVAVVLDADARQVRIPQLDLTRALPRRIGLRATGARFADGEAQDRALQILFFPDASTSGAEITLATGPRQRALSVHWLSGEVRDETP
ncbi:GspH/FimT family protein [uncultured Roseobacter sp.]|uniref:GspH/FimT family protein n=1 Tax=uncultured Roseobacter sp. TaxID=114847 RepID=UPI0026216A6A|nr:GspH/FimT family protein [uncultured Roseobacter sp.]